MVNNLYGTLFPFDRSCILPRRVLLLLRPSRLASALSLSLFTFPRLIPLEASTVRVRARVHPRTSPVPKIVTHQLNDRLYPFDVFHPEISWNLHPRTRAHRSVRPRIWLGYTLSKELYWGIDHLLISLLLLTTDVTLRRAMSNRLNTLSLFHSVLPRYPSFLLLFFFHLLLSFIHRNLALFGILLENFWAMKILPK